MIHKRNEPDNMSRGHQKLFIAAAIAALIIGVTPLIYGHIKEPTTKNYSFSKDVLPVAPTITPVLSQEQLAVCASPTRQADLSNSPVAELRKLAEYETVYGGQVADRMMTFSSTPTSQKQALSQAGEMTARLKEFAANCVPPLVIFEPTNAVGQPLDFAAYKRGKYDGALDAYFQALRKNGITDEMMGVWVPFPEANTPVWGSTQSKLFAANVVKTVGFQKKYFPSSKASIMLDSISYPSNDINWSFGDKVSFSPYTTNIPKGLLDSFGMQGFPWVSPANQAPVQHIDPAYYLDPRFAQEAAQYLGTSNIWFNTGTFSRYYTNDPAQTVTFSSAERQAILSGVVTQAEAAKSAGYNISVNLFSGDKSHTTEGVDWSYWHSPSDADKSGQTIFNDFASKLHQDGIGLWLFDAASN